MFSATITFGEVAENGPGMQQLGVKAAAGLSYEELVRAKHAFECREGRGPSMARFRGMLMTRFRPSGPEPSRRDQVERPTPQMDL